MAVPVLIRVFLSNGWHGQGDDAQRQLRCRSAQERSRRQAPDAAGPCCRGTLCPGAQASSCHARGMPWSMPDSGQSPGCREQAIVCHGLPWPLSSRPRGAAARGPQAKARTPLQGQFGSTASRRPFSGSFPFLYTSPGSHAVAKATVFTNRERRLTDLDKKRRKGGRATIPSVRPAAEDVLHPE